MKASRLRRRLDRHAERQLEHLEATIENLRELLDLAIEDDDGVHLRGREALQSWATLRRDVERIFVDARRMIEFGNEIERLKGAGRTSASQP